MTSRRGSTKLDGTPPIWLNLANVVAMGPILEEKASPPSQAATDEKPA
jgi:hypothetical protein